jgi:hypothetical protein
MKMMKVEDIEIIEKDNNIPPEKSILAKGERKKGEMKKIIGMFAICMVMMVVAIAKATAYEPILDKEHCTYGRRWARYEQPNPARFSVNAFGVTVDNYSWAPAKVGFYIENEKDIDAKAKYYYEKLEDFRNGRSNYHANTEKDVINYTPFVTKENVYTITFDEIKAKFYNYYQNIKDFGIDIRKKQAEADKRMNEER